jgi:hypothetical protein
LQQVEELWIGMKHRQMVIGMSQEEQQWRWPMLWVQSEAIDAKTTQ